MMWLREGGLLLIGLCAGGVVAAGIFAFIVMIGLVPRLAGRTHTGRLVKGYETVILLGAGLGNVLSLYGRETRVGFDIFGGAALLGCLGVACGVFVGCLVMSLAETLDSLPVLFRRTGLRRGLSYMVLAFALGKMAGALLYVWLGMGG